MGLVLAFMVLLHWVSLKYPLLLAYTRVILLMALIMIIIIIIIVKEPSMLSFLYPWEGVHYHNYTMFIIMMTIIFYHGYTIIILIVAMVLTPIVTLYGTINY